METEIEKPIMKTFRLKPSVWELLEQHKQKLGAKDRTDALRIIIEKANVQSAQIDIEALQSN